MEKNDNYEIFDEQVDKFLRHQMSKEEEQEFKSMLMANPPLMSRAKAMALMIKSMNKVGMERDRQIVNEIKGMNESQIRQDAGLKPRFVLFRPKFMRYAAAACVAGLLCWGGVHFYALNQTTSLGNSTDYYAYTMTISEVGFDRGSSDVDASKTLLPLFDNVKDGLNLEETIKDLEHYYKDAQEDGSDYMMYENDIAWNLAIAYLKDGNRKKSIIILNEMIERNRNYPEIYRPAESLLKKIHEL
ncbi:MAG: hypothetical protein K2O88_07290 [Paramuribaculum sp.]|nr:hypothetical protein [Paramuribaculum sp.]